MKHYKILSASEEDVLAEYVQTALNDGWELVGPMVIGPEDMVRGGPFYQPIIKIKPDRGKAINAGPK